MKRINKTMICFVLAVCLTVGAPFAAFSVNAESITEEETLAPAGFEILAKSAVLMDVSTGTVLFAQNEKEALPPASVTKVMTLLLIAEAIELGRITMEEQVTVSEHASSMGGSQVFLEAGESMSVEDLFKSVVMASANDAACALAEHICGSEEAFVAKMNERAIELGMLNTHFENTNGLDDTTVNHVTSAMDIGIMSCQLLRHEFVMNYTTLWMDSIRNGEFTLTNTNRLVRFYPGCTGLKTGSTEKAKFCISASAKRDGMHLVAVIMGAESRDVRNEEAKKLLDYGFSNYAEYCDKGIEIPPIPVKGGTLAECPVAYQPLSAVLDKSSAKGVKISYETVEEIIAPVKKNDVVGKVTYSVNSEIICERDIVASSDVTKISLWEVLARLASVMLGG